MVNMVMSFLRHCLHFFALHFLHFQYVSLFRIMLVFSRLCLIVQIVQIVQCHFIIFFERCVQKFNVSDTWLFLVICYPFTRVLPYYLRSKHYPSTANKPLCHQQTAARHSGITYLSRTSLLAQTCTDRMFPGANSSLSLPVSAG